MLDRRIQTLLRPAVAQRPTGLHYVDRPCCKACCGPLPRCSSALNDRPQGLVAKLDQMFKVNPF